MTYIYDVCTPGDRYLFEAGLGLPTFRPINLDFEAESPVFVDSFLEYKYVKHEGKIFRMHRSGCPIIKSGRKHPLVDFYIEDWRRFYIADLEG